MDQVPEGSAWVVKGVALPQLQPRRLTLSRILPTQSPHDEPVDVARVSATWPLPVFWACAFFSFRWTDGFRPFPVCPRPFFWKRGACFLWTRKTSVYSDRAGLNGRGSLERSISRESWLSCEQPGVSNRRRADPPLRALRRRGQCHPHTRFVTK